MEIAGLPYWEKPPERWLKCPRRSHIIQDLFIAMKTPLKSKYDNCVPPEDQFSVEMLLQSVRHENKRIGLWIDLTNTNRFYDRSVVDSAHIQYVKLPCTGHDGPPDSTKVAEFVQACDSLVTSTSATTNPDPRFGMPLIAVHCTHGFNRTGFLICAYFVERCNYDPQAIFDEFRRARPPGIYKADYIYEFFRRYDDPASAPAAPERPLWCRMGDEFGVAAASVAVAAFSNETSSLAVQQSSSELPNGHPSGAPELQRDLVTGAESDPAVDGNGTTDAAVEFPEDLDDPHFAAMGGTGAYAFTNQRPAEPFWEGKIPSVRQLTDGKLVRELRNMCSQFCNGAAKFDPEAAQTGGFPGSQPVSMDLSNIHFLADDYYRVSWKADGTRYMMLICGPERVFMIDRKFHFYQVPNLEFPGRDGTMDSPLRDTLLDGEMVMDSMKGPKGEIILKPRYLLYDIVHIMDDAVGQLNFMQRMARLVNDVVRPRDQYLKTHQQATPSPFSVRVKDFWDLSYTEKVTGDAFVKNLPHEADGAVFQPCMDAYKAGTCERILKWKPEHLNSIDFRIKLKRSQPNKGMLPELKAELWVKGREVPFTTIIAKKDLRDMDNKIVEMAVEFDPVAKVPRWKFMRERTDKTDPNHNSTAEAVWKSIQNPVTRKILLRFIEVKGKKQPAKAHQTVAAAAISNSKLAIGKVKVEPNSSPSATSSGSSSSSINSVDVKCILPVARTSSARRDTNRNDAGVQNASVADEADNAVSTDSGRLKVKKEENQHDNVPMLFNEANAVPFAGSSAAVVADFTTTTTSIGIAVESDAEVQESVWIASPAEEKYDDDDVKFQLHANDADAAAKRIHHNDEPGLSSDEAADDEIQREFEAHEQASDGRFNNHHHQSETPNRKKIAKMSLGKKHQHITEKQQQQHNHAVANRGVKRQSSAESDEDISSLKHNKKAVTEY